MDRNTRLEDLSTGIFCEIFQYLHALDLFTAFGSLNRRISSILHIIPLRVVVLGGHRRYHVDKLSSHLTSHAHQVISIKIFDVIQDDSSMVDLLFSQHKFTNLQSCAFVSIQPSTQLENVMEQIRCQNKLVSFIIFDPNEAELNENAKNHLLETLFTHQSPSLRSIGLDLSYDYLDLSKYISIPSTLKSLYLNTSSSMSSVYVDSMIPIFRFCHSIEYLSVTLRCSLLISNNDVTNEGLPVNDENLPVLSKVKFFDLMILDYCDGRAVYYMLQCFPNLRYFYFNLMMTHVDRVFPRELLDGSVWKQMLEHCTPCLLKFELDMFIETRFSGLTPRMIVESFVCCTLKYSDWHLIVHRWKCATIPDAECFMLRSLNYEKHGSPYSIFVPDIATECFDSWSTTTTDDYHLFYRGVQELSICISKRANFTWLSPLFQYVQHLVIAISPCSSLSSSSLLWNSLLKIVGVNKIDDDPQNIVSCLVRFVYLPSILHVEFDSTFDISRWREIQLMLQACPNVIEITLDTELLCASKLIDNVSLIPLFKQVKILTLKRKKTYFPPKLSSKIVERFPSLDDVELHVFSFDHCVSVIDHFISHVRQLSFIRIHYFQDTLLDDPFSIDYILKKRREICRDVHLNVERIRVKNDRKAITIWLS